MLLPCSSAEKVSGSCPTRKMQKLPLVWGLLDQVQDLSTHNRRSLTSSATVTEIDDV